MFDYSGTVANEIYSKIKRLIFITTIFSQIIILGYYLYMVLDGKGYIGVDIAILVGCVATTIIHHIPNKRKNSINTNKKRFKNIINWYNFIARAFDISIRVYGIYIAINNVDFITIVLCLASVVIWLISVLLEILGYVIEHYLKKFFIAVKVDCEDMNIFKNDKLTNIIVEGMTQEEIKMVQLRQSYAEKVAEFKGIKKDIKSSTKALRKEIARQERQRKKEVRARKKEAYKQSKQTPPTNNSNP